MRKLLFMITAVAFMFTACEKDSQKDVVSSTTTTDGASVEFKIDLTDFGYKNSVPICQDDLSLDYAFFTIVDAAGVMTQYTTEIYMVGGEDLTQVIKLDTGNYTLTSFVIYHEVADGEDIIVRAAPAFESEYWDLMENRLDLNFRIDAFYKIQYEIDVLCFEELFYDEFGFTWFQYHDVRIEQMCFFGDICVWDYAHFAGSLYEEQMYMIQQDLPAIFEIRVWAEGGNEPLRVFNNEEWLGESDCTPVYWPNRLDVEGEMFDFELWVLLPTGEPGEFTYQLVYTWDVTDGELADYDAEADEDGVVEFVLGNCLYGETDFLFDAYIY